MTSYANGRTPRERLLSQLIIDTETGCVLWTGNLSEGGYGRTTIGGRMQTVHRVMWEMFEGPIPDGFHLDHVKSRGCFNRHCASIAHLEPVTPRENARRSDCITTVQANKTHCDNKHLFDEANTYVIPGTTWRVCRTCRHEAQSRYNASHRRTHLTDAVASYMSACLTSPHPAAAALTDDPAKVTCGNCKRTRAYRHVSAEVAR